MIRVTINGVKFSIFQKDGRTFLCAGNFDFAGEVTDDYVSATGAVVSGETGDIDELYTKWLERTLFHREVMGVKY